MQLENFISAKRMYDDGKLRRPRVYVWEKGENVIENLENRRSRPVQAYRAVARRALSLLGIPHSVGRWSQKAGCSCGCSPGFILDSGLDRYDVHVTAYPVRYDPTAVSVAKVVQIGK